eukprot:369743-Hanusia_phi.AAC.2
MSKERRKMLLSRTDRSPRILNVAIGDFLAPTMPTGRKWSTTRRSEEEERGTKGGWGREGERGGKGGVRGGENNRAD